MDTLRALRQPAALVVLGVVGAKGLLALVMMLTSLDRGVARAAQTWSGSMIGTVSAVLVFAVVLSLVLITPRPPQTKVLVTAAVAVVAGLGVISLIGAFVGLADIGGGGSSLVVWFLRRLLDLAIVALIAFALLRIMVGVTAETPAGQYGAGTGTTTQVAEPGGYRRHAVGPAQGQQTQQGQQGQQGQQQRPDAGAMWGSASQAATGSQVSGWGSGQPGGWGTPHSLPPQPPQQHPQYSQHPQQQHPPAQRPQQGPGPGDGPPEDYTRIAPRRPS